MSSVKFKLVIEIDAAEVYNEELGAECVSGLNQSPAGYGGN